MTFNIDKASLVYDSRLKLYPKELALPHEKHKYPNKLSPSGLTLILKVVMDESNFLKNYILRLARYIRQIF